MKTEDEGKRRDGYEQRSSVEQWRLSVNRHECHSLLARHSAPVTTSEFSRLSLPQTALGIGFAPDSRRLGDKEEYSQRIEQWHTTTNTLI